MNYREICVLLLAVMPAVSAETDYCQANLCDTGKKHIGCGNSGKFHRICRKPKIVTIKPGYRRLIVREHNSLRNKIAKGFKNFPPAKRMATVSWDEELAKLAELNVKQCEMHHDECHNTRKFPFAGQNLAFARWRKIKLSVSEVIADQIKGWFSQYEDCPLEVIKSYKSSNGPPYSHFTTLVQDKSNRIGCAIFKTVDFNITDQIMACNYACDNKLGAPVYSVGKTASECTTGTNSRFRSLCSAKEKYNFKRML